MNSQRACNTLQFWRDVEILAIPPAPKLERIERKRALMRLVDSYPSGSRLPWQPGHELADSGEWLHVVYLGVTETVACVKGGRKSGHQGGAKSGHCGDGGRAVA